MFPCKKVVKKAQADGPVIGESGCLLTNPFRVDRVGRRKHGEVSPPVPFNRLQQQPRSVTRIALNTLARTVVETVELRSIPPRRVDVGHCLRSARQVGTPSMFERALWRVLRDVSFVDAVVWPASK